MKKILLMTIASVGLVMAAAESGSRSQVVAEKPASAIFNMKDSLSFVKELPEVKNFSKEEFNKRVSTEKVTLSKMGGYMLTSILNLQKGLEPVGFEQFWEVYANNAQNLGYTQIARALRLLKEVESFEYETRYYRKVQKAQEEIKRSEEELKKVIESIARTHDDVQKVKEMSLEEAKIWFAQECQRQEREYDSKVRALDELMEDLKNSAR